MLTLATSAKDFFLQQFEATGQLQQVAVTEATNLDYRAAQNGGGGGGGQPAAPQQQGGSGANTPTTPPKMSDALVAKIKALPHVKEARALAF